MQVPWLESLSRARFIHRSPAAKVLIAFAALLVLQALAVTLYLHAESKAGAQPDAATAQPAGGRAAAPR